jgi:hypothetical protein
MLDTPTAARVVQLSAKQLFMMFPTPMFTGMLPDIGLCDRIEKKLRELQKSGKGYPSPGGKILAYMTPDDIQTLPEMKGLVDVIMAESSSILDFYAINRDSHYITKVPKNCGATIFASPRIHSKNIEPTYYKKNEFNADIFSIPPEKGRMLIWPSHVPHAVEQGTADEAEDRIVVAFNVMIRGLIDQPTARLVLS